MYIAVPLSVRPAASVCGSSVVMLSRLVNNAMQSDPKQDEQTKAKLKTVLCCKKTVLT